MTPEEVEKINDYADFDGARVKRMLFRAIAAAYEDAARIAESLPKDECRQDWGLGRDIADAIRAKAKPSVSE